MMDYTLFGESHGAAVGVLIRNIPAGIPVDGNLIANQLLRRRAADELATARHEADEVEFLSGVFQGKTTGMPLTAILRNKDVRSEDYETLRAAPRPGHADYTAWVQSGGCNDYRGGGHFSGRLTAPLTVAGALAQTYLNSCGITIQASVVEEEALRRRAAEAKAEGDSVGGQIACTIIGVPAGIGGPDWTCALESEISRHIFAIPAVKAVGFGLGEGFAAARGSEANDALRTDGQRIYTATNHAGGINGGISNGMPITFTVTFRPTPSIAKEQETVNLDTMTNTTAAIRGRHDACVALRAVPAVEAAAALALCQLIEPDSDDIAVLRKEIDAVDIKIVELFEKRLEIAGKIGKYKAQNHLPVFDAEREEVVLHSRGDLAPEHRQQVETLYRTIMALSREEQKQ